jgi:hypothetical protein
MFELIKEIATIITAITIISALVYRFITAYKNHKDTIIENHKREVEYDDLKKSVIDNRKNMIRLELLLLINNEASQQLVWDIYDNYRKLHGNSYIKKLVYDYCDNSYADKPLE